MCYWPSQWPAFGRTFSPIHSNPVGFLRRWADRRLDDLEEGYRTQVWLAVSEDPAALVSGEYFYHQKPRAFGSMLRPKSRCWGCVRTVPKPYLCRSLGLAFERRRDAPNSRKQTKSEGSDRGFGGVLAQSRCSPTELHAPCNYMILIVSLIEFCEIDYLPSKQVQQRARKPARPSQKSAPFAFADSGSRNGGYRQLAALFFGRSEARSKRSRFITLFHAVTKSFTNFSLASAQA
jgi:hypothetical protein